MSAKFDKNCPFCTKPEKDIILENQYAKAFFDIKPAGPGHMLVVPKAHVHTIFDLNEQEVLAVHQLVVKCKHFLDRTFHPGGYQIGINSYPIGGQSVQHCHVHIIPRFYKETMRQVFPHDKSWHDKSLYKYANPDVDKGGINAKHAWEIARKLQPKLDYTNEDRFACHHHSHHHRHHFHFHDFHQSDLFNPWPVHLHRHRHHISHRF